VGNAEEQKLPEH